MTLPTSIPESPAVEMQDIVLRFPGVLANDHVSFTLNKGEIHALLGENGAGKSSLMNVLTGLYKPQSGTIRVNGKKVVFNSPKDAILSGIGMIHQHFMLVPNQSVTENILIGLDEPRFTLNLKKYDEKVRELAAQFGLNIDPTAKIWQLSVGEQQRVEILKILYRGANILVLDEPTAVLAPQEADELILTLRGMAAQGKSIVFISHKLNEVRAVADRLTILRKGKTTAEGVPLEGLTKEKLASLMVGREVLFNLKKCDQEAGDTVLMLEDVSAMNNKDLPALKNVSLCLKEGEILGIAGVAGNGQSELVEVITGMRTCTGRIWMGGKNIANKTPQFSIEQGLAHIPEDRVGVGTAPNLSITKNVIMKNFEHEPISHRWRLDYTAANNQAKKLREQYDIQSPSVETQARKLSGGNLQKLILARELSSQPRLVVAMQPTRGLDVGAIEGVQQLLLNQREQGCAILLVSEDLDELMDLSDRIAVMYEGEIVGIVNPKVTDINTIGLMMTGMARRGTGCDDGVFPPEAGQADADAGAQTGETDEAAQADAETATPEPPAPPEEEIEPAMPAEEAEYLPPETEKERILRKVRGPDWNKGGRP
jgi:simple sugar transport system ATP-binding protein